jgi:hypothetical protein
MSTGALPAYFTGRDLHKETSYHSADNLRRLFRRAGIDNILGLLSGRLRRDVELLIEGFQSVRTALAHAAPPLLTVADVETLLVDIKALVGAIDKVFYQHVMQHGGQACW